MNPCTPPTPPNSRSASPVRTGSAVLPLYCTFTKSVPVRDMNSMFARYGGLPTPAVVALSLPGFAFMYLTSSGTEVAGTFGFTASTNADSAMVEIGAKSFSTSKPVFV